jgi:glycosyltransferase involved in cell wall biosynthesis
MPALEFLKGLDFWVHYPHEDYIESYGRAVIEAMAVGVPAILPPVFRHTFGEAALYAEPKGVFDAIQRVWASEATWNQRVAAGRRFVLENNDWSRLKSRIKTLTD